MGIAPPGSSRLAAPTRDSPPGKATSASAREVHEQARAIPAHKTTGGNMPHFTRRKILQMSGAGAVATQAGGLAAILATGRAPAYAQGSTIHWLRWADFVPASDVLLKGQITQECQKAIGITLNVETINANDIQARISASIQSGAGPDIFMTLNNWPQLYANSVSDVEDVADDLGKAQGGLYDVCK